MKVNTELQFRIKSTVLKTSGDYEWLNIEVVPNFVFEKNQLLFRRDHFSLLFY
jgi:hypothetical protein